MKRFIKRFFLIDDTPHKIAAGAALGVFLGVAPGVGVAATVVLASIFRFNRVAAIAAVLATNTWSLVVVLPLAATVGGFLFGGKTAYLIEQFNHYYQLGYRVFLSKDILLDIAMPLAVGFVVVSGVSALFLYVLLLSLIKLRREREMIVR